MWECIPYAPATLFPKTLWAESFKSMMHNSVSMPPFRVGRLPHDLRLIYRLPPAINSTFHPPCPRIRSRPVHVRIFLYLGSFLRFSLPRSIICNSLHIDVAKRVFSELDLAPHSDADKLWVRQQDRGPKARGVVYQHERRQHLRADSMPVFSDQQRAAVADKHVYNRILSVRHRNSGLLQYKLAASPWRITLRISRRFS